MSRPAVFMIVAAVAASCSPTGPSESVGLQTNIAKWEARTFASYQVVVRRGPCECLPEDMIPIRVSVTGETISAVVDDRTGEVVTRALFHAMTVDELFALIASALSDDAHRVDVRYDARLGYPRAIDIDYRADVADDEVAITVELSESTG